MTSRLTSVAWITSLIAASLASVITLLLPAGYFLISYQYMIGVIDTKAEYFARTTETLVMVNPEMWKFEEIRLQELLERHREQALPELRRIVARDGTIVAHLAGTPPNPLVTRRSDFYDAGTVVGHIEISRSLRPLIVQTAWIGAGSFLLGTLIFLVLRTIPLKAVRAEQLRSQNLVIQNRQLQKAESLGRMAGAIAHHFNNMLGAVIGNLELAVLNLPPGSVPSAHLTQAMKASHRAAEVSRLMLTYLGQTPGKLEPLDLSEVCRSSLPMLLAAIPNNVSLRPVFPSPGPTIHGDANQMRQLLANLVSNAWEALGDKPGTVRLTVKTVASAGNPAGPRFPVDWQPKSRPYACLEVADTGCGIEGAEIEKIFDPFFTSKFIGRGMGLPVILGIVRAHEGVVCVQSDPGRGSVFQVLFPVSTETIPVRPEAPLPAAALTEGFTVLLIEDEKILRDLTRDMLTHLGHRVLEAKDGVEAVELFQRHREEIQCVLSDLTMPHMDGWETLAALRRLAPHIPVILTSGYEEAQVMAGEHPDRPDAFLGKPFELQGLCDTINRVMTPAAH